MLGKYLNRKVLVILLLTSIFMAIFGLFNQEPCLAEPLNSYQGKAFSLGGEVISDSEFQYYIDQATQVSNQIRQNGMKVTIADIWDIALKIAIHQLAFKQEMTKYSSEINVTNQEAEKLIAKYLPTKEELEDFMFLQGYSTKEALVKAITSDLEHQKFLILKAKEFKIEVSEAELQAELEQITVRFILIGVKDNNGNMLRTREQALVRANEIYDKVVANGNFIELGRKYSDDYGTRDQCGLTGPLSVNDFKNIFDNEFVEYALNLNEGEISKPVWIEYGYCIIYMEKRQMPKDDYNAKYKEAEDKLLLSKINRNPQFEKWLNELYADAEKKAIILDPALQAYRLSEAGELAEAAEKYEEALKLKYYSDKWNVYLDAAQVYLKLKQPDNSLKVLEKVPIEARDKEYQNILRSVKQALHEGCKIDNE